MNYQLKALTQSCWEDMFSKQHVRKQLRKRLADSEMLEPLNRAVDSVYNHYVDNGLIWYESKQNNWDAMCVMQIVPDIVLDMFIIIIQNQYINIQAIVGQLVPLFEGNLPTINAVKTLSEVLVVIAENTDLWDVLLPFVSEEGVITVQANYEFDEETLQYLANIKYLPPMLVRPKMVNKNFDLDYFTNRSSKILGAMNHHEDPIALDVINIMNGVPLMLDTMMLRYDEVPNKELDTLDKVEQFQRMVQASKEVYQAIYENGNRFFFTHKYDKRGRLYSQGYHINIQSTDFKKSLISLAKGEVLHNF